MRCQQAGAGSEGSHGGPPLESAACRSRAASEKLVRMVGGQCWAWHKPGRHQPAAVARWASQLAGLAGPQHAHPGPGPRQSVVWAPARWPHLCGGIHDGQVEEEAACGTAAARPWGQGRAKPGLKAGGLYGNALLTCGRGDARGPLAHQRMRHRPAAAPRTVVRRRGRRHCQTARRLGGATAWTPPPSPSGAPASGPCGHTRCKEACRGGERTELGGSIAVA